jgi:transposase
MRQPIYVRELSTEEREALEKGLRSSNGFTVRRCQILLSSAEGKHSGQITAQLHCNDQTVRNAIRDFHQKGLEALQPGSNRPHSISYKIEPEAIEPLKELIHQSPREYGEGVSFWTLSLVAKVTYEQQIIKQPVTGEAMRQALKRQGISWKRAKKWITSPDPAYELKKSNETD